MGNQVERVASEVVVGVGDTDVADELVVYHQVMRDGADRDRQEADDSHVDDDGDGVGHVEVLMKSVEGSGKLR